MVSSICSAMMLLDIARNTYFGRLTWEIIFYLVVQLLRFSYTLMRPGMGDSPDTSDESYRHIQAYCKLFGIFSGQSFFSVSCLSLFSSSGTSTTYDILAPRWHRECHRPYTPRFFLLSFTFTISLPYLNYRLNFYNQASFASSCNPPFLSRPCRRGKE